MTSPLHPNGSRPDVERIYGVLRLIRRVEERIAEIYPSDKIKSPVHLSIGEEAVAVAVCDALRPDDHVVGTYRGHALFLAKGGDLRRFMAEMYGKIDGCAAGKGGSMHLVSMAVNMLGSSAVVSTNIPIALGVALKLKQDGGGNVMACFFGDGATEEGVFYESLNFAALKKLPVLFVCENNGLAIHAAIEKRWAKLDIRPRVEGFGVPTGRVETGDVFDLRTASRRRPGTHPPRRGTVLPGMPNQPMARPCRPQRGFRRGISVTRRNRALDREKTPSRYWAGNYRKSAARQSTLISNGESKMPSPSPKTAHSRQQEELHTDVFAD